jgi:hypothetical protein
MYWIILGLWFAGIATRKELQSNWRLISPSFSNHTWHCSCNYLLTLKAVYAMFGYRIRYDDKRVMAIAGFVT